MKKKILIFIAGLVFAVICFITINAITKPFSASEFCGSQCHIMNTAYQTWELSSHGSNEYGITVKCVDCHLPPKDKYFTHLFTKAFVGAKDFYKFHIAKIDYDVEKSRQKVIKGFKNHTCQHCHDNLLAKPASSATLKAHKSVLLKPDAPESNCIKCHESTGHQRISKLFEK